MRLGLSVIMIGVVVAVVAGCERAPSALTQPGTCIVIRGTFTPAAPGFIVSYKPRVDPVAMTAALEKKYAFSANYVYTAVPGFSAELSATALAGVSCDSSVAAIDHNGVTGFAAR